MRRVVGLVNAAGVPVAAVDLPSGVSGETGRVLGAAFRAVLTVRASARKPAFFKRAIDLGCGTGLAATAFAKEVDHFTGIDLSPRMIERARAKLQDNSAPLYDKLAVAGLTGFLVSRPDASSDLVIAADVFVYLGELGAVFAQSARVLKPGGLLAFTVQSHAGEGVIVGADRRFAHAEGWLRDRLAEARLKPLLVEAASTRQDRGVAVPGLIVVAQRG